MEPSAFNIDERKMLVDYLRAGFYPAQRQRPSGTFVIEIRRLNHSKKIGDWSQPKWAEATAIYDRLLAERKETQSINLKRITKRHLKKQLK